MAGDAMRFRNPAGHAGLLTNLVSLANSLAVFFETRLHLFAAESKGAFLHLILLAAAVVGALVLLISGYVFLIVSAIFWIAQTAGVSWMTVTFCAALLHFLLALGCGLFARSQLMKPMFEASVTELKRDREWLKSVTQRQNERSTS